MKNWKTVIAFALFLTIFLSGCQRKGAEMEFLNFATIRPIKADETYTMDEFTYATDGTTITVREKDEIRNILNVHDTGAEGDITQFTISENYVYFLTSAAMLYRWSFRELRLEPLLQPTEYAYITDFFMIDKILYLIATDEVEREHRLYYYDTETGVGDFMMFLYDWAAGDDILYVSQKRTSRLFNNLYYASTKNPWLISADDLAKQPLLYIQGDIEIDPDNENIVYFSGCFDSEIFYDENNRLIYDDILRRASYNAQTRRITILE